MGLFGMLGKAAGSKVVEKVEDELTKRKNREQTSNYCKYIKNNMCRIHKILDDLESETKSLIEEINSKKGIKLSFKEKGDFRKLKDKAHTNLQYLYLSRDFFTTLAKNASGLILKNEELFLVTKFAPFFDGVPVLDIDDEEDDDSVLGVFKNIGKELKEVFISSKKDSNHIDFEEYLYRYKGKLEEYVIPDIKNAIDNFNQATVEQDSILVEKKEPEIVTTSDKMNNEIECLHCHVKLSSISKFCPECGTKLEIKKPAFCTQCGEPIAEGSKFCANCGTKL